MKKIKLGKTGLEISAIGLGCWQFSKGSGMIGKFWPELEDDEIKAIIKESLDNGIDWFDTAEIYGNGESEKMTSKMLKELGKTPNDVIIADKWWPAFRTASSIVSTIDERLESLNGFPITLYQVHQPFSFSSAENEMEKMAELVKNGKIKYVGVSNFSKNGMEKADTKLKEADYSLTSNQVKYNLLDRKIESNGVMDYAKENDITIIAYSPLEQGLLTGKFHDDPELIKSRSLARRFDPKFGKKNLDKTRPVIDLLKNLAKKYEVTPSQVALNWLVSFNGGTVAVIPGATKSKHAGPNARSTDFNMTDEELNELDRITENFK